MAELEGGRYGFMFSAGLTAAAAAFSVLDDGAKVIITKDVYGSDKGGKLGLLQYYVSRFGFIFEYVDTSDLIALESAFDEKTKAVYLETPSNPLMSISDIQAISNLAKERNIITIVENTFLSPYLQRPLALGADIVVESATKFLAGHNDVTAGVVAVKNDELAEKISLFQRLFGGITQPLEAFLITRGLKTLSVRMDRQITNCEHLIEFLKSSPYVGKIYYPGLPEHPGYEINRRQSKKPGSMVAFETAGIRIRVLLDNLRVICHATSLGGVESVIQHFARSSYASHPSERRAEAGVSDNLLRISVGIEHPDDIIADLRGAFEEAKME
jgi:cystathionine beta-lyase